MYINRLYSVTLGYNFGHNINFMFYNDILFICSMGLETVQSFTYPKRKIPNNGKSRSDFIICRIALAKQTWTITLHTKKYKKFCVKRSSEWSRNLDYTLRRESQNRIFWSMVMEKNAKISMDRKGKNVEVFRRMNIQKSIWNTVKLRRKSCFGYLVTSKK